MILHDVLVSDKEIPPSDKNNFVRSMAVSRFWPITLVLWWNFLFFPHQYIWRISGTLIRSSDLIWIRLHLLGQLNQYLVGPHQVEFTLYGPTWSDQVLVWMQLDPYQLDPSVNVNLIIWGRWHNIYQKCYNQIVQLSWVIKFDQCMLWKKESNVLFE